MGKLVGCQCHITSSSAWRVSPTTPSGKIPTSSFPYMIWEKASRSGKSYEKFWWTWDLGLGWYGWGHRRLQPSEKIDAQRKPIKIKNLFLSSWEFCLKSQCTPKARVACFFILCLFLHGSSNPSLGSRHLREKQGCFSARENRRNLEKSNFSREAQI